MGSEGWGGGASLGSRTADADLWVRVGAAPLEVLAALVAVAAIRPEEQQQGCAGHEEEEEEEPPEP